MSVEAVHELGRSLSNWGRWGAADEIGTLNFITPARRRAAAELVRTGEVVRCGLNYDDQLPWTDPAAAMGRFNPVHTMTITGNESPDQLGLSYADDEINMPLQSGTQWDALAHIHYDGLMYNNRAASEITGSGAGANSIDKVGAEIVGRGVLLDLARWRGVDRLSSTTSITPADLDGCAAAQGVALESGDIVLVRTGHVGYQVAHGWENMYQSSPGLGLSCARWLHDHDVAAVATDTLAVEAVPSDEAPGLILPLHQVCIRNMGLTFGELFVLDDLGEQCHTENRWEFFFVGAPLPITGAVGSPINPFAVF